jgi:hypothetical protein
VNIGLWSTLGLIGGTDELGRILANYLSNISSFACYAHVFVEKASFLFGDCDKPIIRILPYNKKTAFKSKVVWIAGASSGIGAQLALDLARAGAQVVISARRIQNLEDVATQCATVGLKPLILPLDVTNADECQKATDKIIAQFGRIDVLILNAGRTQRYLAAEMPFKDTKDLMELNFLSLVNLAKLVLPTMLSQKAGQVRVQ